VPHALISQWETYVTRDTTLRALFIKRKLDATSDTFMTNLETYDAIFVSSTMWATLKQTHPIRTLLWNRVFVDEADSISVTTDWDDVNGLFYCCKELSKHMRARAFGRIVNIASVAGKDGNPNASAYSASKAAVIGLTKSLGKELADTGVRVNCVTPAAVKTAIFDQMSAEHIQFMLSKIPMGRFGLPAEVAALVCWLCTEDCSFSTGAVFDLSGGRATY
jgi:NAD(P)-dependent dehydrogenase (short-subunit alcohol dehydrogenase family)